MLKANIDPDIVAWDFGWKHFFTVRARAGKSPEYLFLVIYRNAGDWLKSFYQNPWHAAPELRGISRQEFLRREWHSVFDQHHCTPDSPKWHTDMPDDLDPRTGRRFRNVIAMRNGKVAHFEALRERFDNVCYLRYEDLNANPERVIRLVAARYGLPLPDDFRPVTKYKGIGGRYVPRRYAPLNPSERWFILRELNHVQEFQIGYSPVSLLLS